MGIMNMTSTGRWSAWCAMGIVLLSWTDVPGTGLRCEAAEPPERDRTSVRMVVDYGDGVEKHFRFSYAELVGDDSKISVADVMRAADRHERGIKVVSRGASATYFVLQIDDIRNESGRGRNWIYRVNDTVGTRSAGVQDVQPGDTVLWRFENYQ